MRLKQTTVFWMLVFVIVGAIAPTDARAQTSSVPPGAIRVNDSYQPDPNGNWWMLNNYVDSAPAYGVLNLADTYNFQENLAGFPIPLADPSVMGVRQTPYGTWWYVTGTSAATGTGNFPIYRTQDFRTFELHMFAFDPSNQGAPASGQYSYINPSYPNLTITRIGAYDFNSLWMGHLHRDFFQAAGQKDIYLSFSARRNSFNEIDRTCYVVKMKEADFFSWHTKDPYGDGPRFCDNRQGAQNPAWYYYTPTNTNSPPFLYDGGHSHAKLIPVSGDSSIAGPYCGQLEGNVLGMQYRCHGAAPRMVNDVTVYIDSQLPIDHPWKQVIMYNWTYKRFNTPASEWGVHIAAAPLSSWIRTNKDYSAIPIASSMNANNPILDINGVLLPNGSMALGSTQWANGGVAEGGTVIYMGSTQRYYVFYSRNTWDSSAYQIVYRMTEPGAALSTLALPGGFADLNAPEYVLLKAPNLLGGGQNFGQPHAFALNHAVAPPSGPSGRHMLAFHAKLQYEVQPGVFTGRRTVFFKELTIANQATGELMQWHLNSVDPRTDIKRFVIPVNRQ